MCEAVVLFECHPHELDFRPELAAASEGQLEPCLSAAAGLEEGSVGDESGEAQANLMVREAPCIPDGIEILRKERGVVVDHAQYEGARRQRIIDDHGSIIAPPTCRPRDRPGRKRSSPSASRSATSDPSPVARYARSRCSTGGAARIRLCSTTRSGSLEPCRSRVAVARRPRSDKVHALVSVRSKDRRRRVGPHR